MTVSGNVFITGANRGIGFGLVKQLAKIGTVKNVFAGVRNPDNVAVSFVKI